MAFQDTAGGIVLDATLPDLGRKYMAQGRFKVTKFALGDDEIDYRLGASESGDWKLNKDPSEYPIFEAPAVSSAVIISGLLDFDRSDLMFLPEYKITTGSVRNAVELYDNAVLFSVNDETTQRLSTTVDLGKYVLENNSYVTNMLILECGFESGSVLVGGPKEQERFIYNMDLYDKYAFVYCDSRFFQRVLSNQPMSHYENDNNDTLYENFQPLVDATRTSMTAITEEQDTYYCVTAKNSLYDFNDGAPERTKQSIFAGPRSVVLGLNFSANDKLISKSNAAADLRYTKFGKTGVDLFGDGNLYDFIDTRVTVEGCATTRQKQVTIRILRFSGT